jgi:tetratricopeptide (TPR) repeat protein
LDLFLVAVAGPLASLTFGLAGLLLTLTIAAALVYQSEVSTDVVLPYLFLDPTKLPAALNLHALTIALTGSLAKANLALAFVSLLPLPGLDGFAALMSLIALARQRRQEIQPQPAVVANDPQTTFAAQQHRRNSVAEIHFKAGAQFHQQQQYTDAIARYQQAIRNDQYFGPAYVNLGLAYLAKGDRPKAIQSFRGATRYADDKKSQQEAWQQLQQLSEMPPISDTMLEESKAQGVTPWTDTKPRPNWFNLGLSSVLLLVGAIGLYSYLLVQLVKLLKA